MSMPVIFAPKSRNRWCLCEHHFLDNWRRVDYAEDVDGPVGDGATNPSIWLTQSQPAADVDNLI